MLVVTKLSPGRSFRAMEANLFQHVFSAYAVKGISKVYQQEPLVVDVDVGVVIEGAGGMNYALSGSSDPDPKLERREIVGGVCCCFSRHAYLGIWRSSPGLSLRLQLAGGRQPFSEQRRGCHRIEKGQWRRELFRLTGD